MAKPNEVSRRLAGVQDALRAAPEISVVLHVYETSSLIDVAEPDLATPGKLHAFAVPVDNRLMDQWHLQNTGFHRDTGVGFHRAADARVVIDDGFDLSHPDLRGDRKVVAPKDSRAIRPIRVPIA